MVQPGQIRHPPLRHRATEEVRSVPDGAKASGGQERARNDGAGLRLAEDCIWTTRGQLDSGCLWPPELRIHSLAGGEEEAEDWAEFPGNTFGLHLT